MKFTSAFSLLAYAIKVGTTQAEEATCDKCLPLPPDSKSFQTIRYYNITDPNWTAEQAMEEAAKTTALQLAKMPGFQRYTAATTGDSQLVLFMNQFDSAEQAKAAQDAAANNLDPSWANANDDKLELFAAAVTEGYAVFPEGGCFTESQVGKRLTSCLATYQDPASVDIAEQFTLEQDLYNVLYSQIPGFVMTYVSTNVPDGSDKANWRIMDSEADEAAFQALKAEKGYETGAADDLIIFTSGTIGLDILCSSHHLTDATDVSVSPPAPANTATAKASKASSAKSSKTADAKAEKTSSAKAAKAESVKATKEPKAKKTSPPKTAKATKAFSTSSKATKASPTPSAKATNAVDAKADKASSAKASKAKSSSKGGKAGSLPHPTVIMPIGPSPCPCWSQSDLNAITADSVRGPGIDSCLTVGDSLHTNLRLVDPSKGFILVGGVGDDLVCFRCDYPDCSPNNRISKEEFETCTQQIKDRCDEISSPVPPDVTTCPCFDSKNLLDVTAENTDESSCELTTNGSSGFRGLSSSGANVSFSAQYDGNTFECSSQNQSQDITEGEINACFVLIDIRCQAIKADE